MARKGENIYKRKDGRWEGRYLKGYKPDGEPHYGYVYGEKYNEVKAKLLPLKAESANRDKKDIYFCGTLDSWVRYWMEDEVRKQVRDSTFAFYSGMLRNHILPALGAKSLNSIKREDVQELVNALTEKGLGANTVNGIMGILVRMMKAAVERKALLLNPCNGIVLPQKEPPKVKALDQTEQKKLEAAAHEDKDGLAVLLALETGMRVGEISALKWDDVDLQRGALCVTQTAQRITNEGGGTRVIIDDPKSAYSIRSIPLTDTLKGLLAWERARSQSDYVISCGKGLAEPRVVGYRFARIAKKAGLTGVRFHSLRHTFATRAMELGMNITTLSQILGHASVKMTLDVYTDSSWEQKAEAMARYERRYSRKKKTA